MPNPLPPIETDRLDLHHMTPAVLQAVSAGEREETNQLLGAAVPEELWSTRSSLANRLEQVCADPDFAPWLPRAMVLRAEQIVVGHINFHTAPGPDYFRDLAPGGIELGYTVFPHFRGRGYATEACRAMMDWAQGRGVERFVLSIDPKNQPSLRIAARLGFVQIGTHIDEIDGLEEIYARSAMDPV